MFHFNNFVDDLVQIKQQMFVAIDHEQRDQMNLFVDIEILSHEQHQEVKHKMWATYKNRVNKSLRTS